MVVHAFPVAKLGALLVKQISKPIANAVKSKAKSSPTFRTYVCLPPAQFYNWCEVKAKMWILAMGKPVNITVMNEEMAIELGANLLGEGVIFIIAAGILIAEYTRSSRKEAAKEDEKRKEMEELQRTLTELFMQSEEQAAHIREFSRKLADLETKVVTKPWASKKDTGDNSPPQPPREPPAFIAPLLESQDISDEQLPQQIVQDPKSSKITKACVCKLEDNTSRMGRCPQHSGLLTTAIYNLEQELWRDPDRQRHQGVLAVALNHLYRNVYKSQLNF